ncbi:right-handed parallel beta-helix repeat-containing protein [Streptomyces sp. NPDC101234]|uniref:right-handed parallel beta-helix repeat-containing protein n=1 Tax=Streptomyces sp. NPDC101234 TaxID=3366138 RepID=UPI0038249052
MKRTFRTMTAGATVLTALAMACATASTAHAADPAQSALAAWQRVGRPDRLIVIRPGAVDLVHQGVLVSRRGRKAGAVPMSWLVADTGPNWIAQSADDPSVVQVKAAILLSPGAGLRIGEVSKKVLFTAGDSATSATWIRGSRASLDIRDTTLAAAGPDGGSPGDSSPVRPYIYMGAGGRLDVTDSTVTGFGLRGKAPANFSGVTWGTGSSGSAVGATFEDNRTGLRVAGATGVRLDDVTAKDSVEDGVVLNRDTGTSVARLTAAGSGRDGVVVGGTAGRSLSGVTTRDSKGTGVKATSQDGLRLLGVDSRSDRRGGIRLLSCRNCTVTDAAVQHTDVALAISGPGSAATVDNPRLSDGRTGISLGKDIRSATVAGGTVSGFERGISVSGPRTTVTRTRVADSRTGITVRDKAHDVALTDVTVAGGRTGVTAASTATHVSLTRARIEDASAKGLTSASPQLLVKGGSVSGANTAVDLRAPARLDGLAVTDAYRGLHLAANVHAAGTGLDVLAEHKGVEADRGAVLDVTDSRVRAPLALAGAGRIMRHGRTQVTLPPFPWLGFAAIVALLASIALQTIHQVRHRGTRAPKVARHVRNTA